MVNPPMVFFAIIEMTALGTFGFFCLGLICFGLPIKLVYQTFKKPAEKLTKGKKRIPGMDQLSNWDYLVIILPAWLMLISIFTDVEQQNMCLVILGISGPAFFLGIPNNRIEFFQGQILFFSASIMIAIFAVFIKLLTIPLSYVGELNLLFAPLTSFIYLITSRYIVKRVTGKYPITLDKYSRVGTFYSRYNRKTSYWDLAWSMFNLIVCFGIFILFLSFT